jgi:hypothetical protein
MNTQLTVKKTTDSNYIPVKYRIVEMIEAAATVTGTGEIGCILETIRVGWDTETNYNNWTDERDRPQTGMQGTMGELSYDTLDNLSVYTPMTPSFDQ